MLKIQNIADSPILTKIEWVLTHEKSYGYDDNIIVLFKFSKLHFLYIFPRKDDRVRLTKARVFMHSFKEE